MEKENNVDNSQSQETKSELKSNEEQQTKTSEKSSQDEKKSLDIEKNRMISLALLEASMRYREAYFREDFEAYAAHLESGRAERLTKAKEGLKKNQSLNERVFHRRFDEKAKLFLIEYKNKQEAWNRSAYNKISEVVDMMPVGFYNRFDNYATGFAILMEEFLKAKNTTELLTVCKLYNDGAMDHVFENIRKLKDEGVDIKPAIVAEQEEVQPEGNDEEVNHLP